MTTLSQNREFYRVPAKIRVFFSPETFEARQAMIADYEMVMALAPEMPEHLRRNFTDLSQIHEKLRPIYSLLQWVDFKVDAALFQLRVLARNNIFNNHLITSDISTTGFGFTKPLDVPVNTKLLLSLHLPDDPVRPLYTVGVLIRNGETTGGQPIEQSPCAIRFDELSDMDEERISRFAFSYERKLKQKGELA